MAGRFQHVVDLVVATISQSSADKVLISERHVCGIHVDNHSLLVDIGTRDSRASQQTHASELLRMA
jgi:chromosome condensin MukBEF MukE localization factor